MPRGRPRTEETWITRRWKVTVRKRSGTEIYTAFSRVELNKLLATFVAMPDARVDHEGTYYELRTWIPVPYWDPNDYCTRYTHEKITLKGETKADIYRRLQERKDSVLRQVDNPNWHSFGPKDHQRAQEFINEAETRREAYEAEQRIPTLGSLIERTIAQKKERGEIEESYAETALIQYNTWVKRMTTPSTDPKLYVEPFALADIRVDRLTQAHLQEFIDSLTRTPNRFKRANSPKTIENILAGVRSAWNTLHASPELKHLTSNLRFEEQFLRRPKAKTVRPNETYTNEEVESILRAARDETDAALLALGLIGLRVPGEACGVRWEDLYESDGKTFISVTRQIDHVGGRRVLKPLKTGEKGIKVLYVPQRLKELIFAAKPIADEAGSQFVLCGNGGTGESAGSLSPSSAQEKFKKIKELAGIKGDGKTFYGLRHTVMTALAAAGDTEAAIVAGAWTTAKTARRYIKHKSETLLPTAFDKLPWATSNKESAPG